MRERKRDRTRHVVSPSKRVSYCMRNTHSPLSPRGMPLFPIVGWRFAGFLQAQLAARFVFSWPVSWLQKSLIKSVRSILQQSYRCSLPTQPFPSGYLSTGTHPIDTSLTRPLSHSRHPENKEQAQCASSPATSARPTATQGTAPCSSATTPSASGSAARNATRTLK